jgi:hypothetical protein
MRDLEQLCIEFISGLNLRTFLKPSERGHGPTGAGSSS